MCNIISSYCDSCPKPAYHHCARPRNGRCPGQGYEERKYGFVLVIFFFGPESPRYLISKGKHEKAREFFVKYHGGGDEDPELVNFQMAEITSTLEAEKEQKMSRWTEWFSSKAMIHRLAIVTIESV